MALNRFLINALMIGLGMGALNQSCSQRPGAFLTRNSDDKPSGAKVGNQEFEEVSTKEAESFDAEMQNGIFGMILNDISKDSCTESQGRPEVRLITAQEYISGAEDAFGIDLDDEILMLNLPTDTVEVLGFDHFSQFNKLSKERLERYLDVNGRVAKQVREELAANVINCGKDAKACIQDWLEENLPKLWRMKIDGETIQREMANVNTFGADADGFAILAERLLLSHNFLYRKQLGLDGTLDSWEVASILADSLWAGPPSAELVSLANNGRLNSANSIRSQAEAMIADPMFYDGVKRFTEAWLTTKKIDRKDFAAAGNMDITDDVKASLKEESAGFLYYLVRSGQNKFSDIFDADFTVGNQAFANVYNLSPSSSNVDGLPNGMMPLQFPADRKGLASQPSVAVVSSNLETTNPPKRGKEIMEKFLCQTLETPENIADVVANTKFDKEKSVIDAFDEATNFGTCAGCHSVVNGPGFGMENVGSDGRIRTQDDHGFAVMANLPGSLLVSMESKNGKPFSGVAGLSETLKDTKEVEVCLAVQAFRMVYGRLEKEQDTCTIANAYKRSISTELEFDKLFVELIVQRSLHTK
ncbi:DUF1592 domain-containing protein [Pseudobacteriovorax antillogorgiicola]|uniref:Cytochrome c domain-containing protein n=1 Tax=Pseudobacteriovorax antillogorgiicola TaxID=1513793 RepID=A0A1Y6BCB4_9BACT|nr:DUF1592 domain-containing protein [Pseudobacteriovorax antillogorgiicola]TCS57475.1 uncharacterized protein DUF1585 [Pseudobacteriovorax antillogorgiicola]SMF00577.1 Protein of unknown function [Pseudobacteriovorax antillogorgiicola]